jgi:hypothetical protein
LVPIGSGRRTPRAIAPKPTGRAGGPNVGQRGRFAAFEFMGPDSPAGKESTDRKRAMNKLCNALRQLRLWSQPAIYFGVVMIAAIWASVNFHLAVEHDRSRLAAIQNTSNLARVFEEHIVSTLMEIDRAIVLLIPIPYQSDLAM